jgi:recA bacterial DNA recombination protein
MPSAVKIALEDLLRSRRLQADEPLLRGEDARGRALATGIAGLDDLLLGGFPRGQVSEVHGASSSGRTALVLALAARLTRAGSLVAWVDPGDRLDPASAAAAGVHLARLLWLRGEGRTRDTRALPAAVSAVGTLLGSGLFDAVVLDLAGTAAAARQRLPGTTWIRLQRLIEDQPTALVLVGDGHVAHGPGGAALALRAAAPRWSGTAPARLLRGVGAEVREARRGLRGATVELQACS